MGCKLSMPLRSLRRATDRHEKLDEDDELYFRKVQARNRASFQVEWNGFGSELPTNAGFSKEPTESTEHDSLVHGDDEESRTDQYPAAEHIEGNTLVIETAAPTFPPASNQPKTDVASKRRLERSQSPFSGVASPLSRQSFDSWSSAGDSQFDAASDVSSEVFDTLLPSGMIWEVVKRTGKVTAVAISNSQSDEVVSQQDDELLLVAVGTDDGKVCVVEIRDEKHAKSTFLEQGFPQANENLRNLGSSHEVTRKGKIRSLDLSLSRVGHLLAVAGDDCIVSIYRIIIQNEAGKCELAGLDLVCEMERVDRIYSARFSPDGKWIALGGFDSIVAMAAVSWVHEMDEDERNALKSCQDHKPRLHLVEEIHRSGLILCLDWKPDGEIIAVGGTDKCVVLFDKARNVVGEIPRVGQVECVKWNPDGLLLAFVCGDRLAIAKADTLEVVSETIYRERSQQATRGLYDEVTDVTPKRARRIFTVCWSPDGAFIAIGKSDGNCELLTRNSDSGILTRVHVIRRLASVTSLAWGEKPCGARFLLIGGEDNCVAILKAGIDFEGSTSSVMEDTSSTASSSYLSTESRSLQEWVFKEGSFIDVDDSPEGISKSRGEPSACQRVTCMAFSKCGKSKASPYFAFATERCVVSIATTKKWDSIARLEFVKPIRSMQFSKNTNNVLLVLAGDDAMVYVVSVSNQQLIAEKLMSAPITSLGFSVGNERLAVASVDGVLALLDPSDDFEVVGEIDNSDATILTLDWCSKRFGIGRIDGSVAIYNTDDVLSNFFVPQMELPIRKRKAILSLAFGVRGRFLAVASDDGKLSVYSEKGDWVLCHQLKIDNAIKHVSWSPTGRYLGYCASGLNQTCKVIDTVLWVEVNELQTAFRNLAQPTTAFLSLKQVNGN